VSEHYRLHPVANAELGQDSCDMRLHGCIADDKAPGDFGVREPFCHEAEDLGLSRGEVDRQLGSSDVAAKSDINR